MSDQEEKWTRDPRVTEFLRACGEDTARAETMLREWPDLLSSDATVGHETPLHWLTVENDCRAVEFLIRQGASIKTHDHYGETPLIAAASQGLLDMVKLLLESGADPNFRGIPGGGIYGTALNALMTHSPERLDVAALLIEKGADINAEAGALEETPLGLAAKNGDVKAIRFLLERGAHVHVGGFGESALHRAAGSSKCGADVIELLIAAGADPRGLSEWGQTAHQRAIEAGNLAAADVLAKATGERQETKDRPTNA